MTDTTSPAVKPEVDLAPLYYMIESPDFRDICVFVNRKADEGYALVQMLDGANGYVAAMKLDDSYSRVAAQAAEKALQTVERLGANYQTISLKDLLQEARKELGL